jgi:imidazolonepropionase
MMQNKYANARKMIDYGLSIALATDLNPNCYNENMQEIISLSVYNMKMKIEEAITASTFNAALAAGFNNKGLIEEGYDADIIILDIPEYTHIGYHFGINLVKKVIKNGKELII